MALFTKIILNRLYVEEGHRRLKAEMQARLLKLTFRDLVVGADGTAVANEIIRKMMEDLASDKSSVRTDT